MTAGDVDFAKIMLSVWSFGEIQLQPQQSLIVDTVVYVCVEALAMSMTVAQDLNLDVLDGTLSWTPQAALCLLCMLLLYATNRGGVGLHQYRRWSAPLPGIKRRDPRNTGPEWWLNTESVSANSAEILTSKSNRMQ